MDKKLVTQFYSNKEPSQGNENLRSFNNWVKAVMIDMYSKKEQPIKSVYDLACGRGGDIGKWMSSCPELEQYYGLDIAEGAIEAARNRASDFLLKKGRKKRIRFHFTCRDIAYYDFHSCQRPIDIVSCQFAAQYFLSGYEEMLNFFYKVKKLFTDKGKHYLLLTLPDDQVVNDRREKYGNEFGNDTYRIDFKDQKNQYVFSLNGCVNACPEYLIPFNLLQKAAEQYQFQLELHQNFRYFATEQWSSYKTLRDLMHVDELNVTRDVWETAGLYSVIVFSLTVV